EMPAPGRRVIVLADMLELGEQASMAHELLLEPLRALAPALFFGLGPQMRALADTLAGEGWPAEGFLESRDLTPALKSAIRPGDTIFFKGSHGYALEKVAAALLPEERKPIANSE